MRKHLFLVVISWLFFVEITSAQGWDKYTSPRSRHINQIHCKDNGEVLAVGGHEFNDSIQSVFTSSDGCSNMNIILDNVDPWLTSFAQINNTTFAAGFDGTIMKSIDFGNNWEYLTIPDPVKHRHFNSVDFFDVNKGVVVGGNPENDSIMTIIKTSNGGESWSIVKDLPGSQLNDVFYLDGNNLITVGDMDKILISSDGGDTWVESKSGENRNFYSCFFITDNIGFVVGGMPTADSLSTIIKTTDGGENWEFVVDEPGSCLRDIYFIDDHIGYIVGDDMAYYKTNNGGTTWEKEELPFASDLYDLRSVFFLTENFGYVAGTNGQILKYNPNHLDVDDITSFSNIKLLNNPVKEFFEIEFSDESLWQVKNLISIEILDIKGTSLERRILSNSYFKLDFTKYPKGMYFYKITKQNKILGDGKFIKN